MKLEKAFKRSSVEGPIKSVAINTILKFSKSVKVGPKHFLKMDIVAQEREIINH